MDEFRRPRRQPQSSLATGVSDANGWSGQTQIPNQNKVAATSGLPLATASAARTSRVNASLLGGAAPKPGGRPTSQPSKSLTPVAAVPNWQPPQTVAPPQPVHPTLPPVDVQPSTPPEERNFSMPRPETVSRYLSSEPAPMTEGQAAQPKHLTPFDIATIIETNKPKNRLSAGRAWRKWMITSGVAMFALLLGTGGLLFAQGLGKAHQVFRGTAVKTSTSNITLLNGEKEGRVNILLLGNGGGGHDAPDLTDTMMVESIDTIHKTSTLLSVPRDLWVQMPGHGSMKLNAVYETGKYDYLHKIDNSNANTAAVDAGFTQIDQAISTVLGIQIHYNLLVNFQSFKQAIDAVGGVTVIVPEDLYDPTMAWENAGNPVLAKAGVQQMDGTAALRYVRSRETSSDFARGERQRSVLLALKTKVLQAGTLSNPLKVSQLLSAFGDNMVSDMSLSEALRAYNLGKGISDNQIKSVDLVTKPNDLVTTGTMGNASVDLPKAGLYNYTDIKAYIQQLFNPTATTTAASSAADTVSPVLAVFNGTARVGLAESQGASLRTGGYTVATIGNAPDNTYTKTVLVDLSGGKAPKTRQYLESHYGVTATTTVPDAAIHPGSANFIVILGNDQVH